MKTRAFTFIRFLLVVFIFACTKDLNEEPHPDNAAEEPFISLVKNFYREAETKLETKTNDVASDSKKPLKLYPVWARAFIAKNEKFELAEVPVGANRKEVSLYNFTNSAPLSKTEQLAVARSSFQRLLVFRNKAGVFKQAVVTFIPDLHYLKKHGYDASANKLLAMRPDFSGYLEYSSREGQVLFVLRLVNGKVFKKYRPAGVKLPSGGKSKTTVKGRSVFVHR